MKIFMPLKVLASILFCLFFVLSQAQTKVSNEDLTPLIGSWEGTITYLDYQTNKPFTMSANVNISSSKKEGLYLLQYIYPTEPNANSKEKLRLSKDGKSINKREIILSERLDNGSLKIHVLKKGKDDRKTAQLRYTYLISDFEFIILKEVQFVEESDWIKRSEYRFKKTNP